MTDFETEAMSLTGADAACDLLDDLAKADRAEFKAGVKSDARDCARPIHAAAKAGAPRKSGRLAKATKLRVWKTKDRGEVGVKIEIARGDSRDDPNGAWYGPIVESGHIVGNRYVPGVHMIERSWVSQSQSAADALGQRVMSRLDGLVTKPSSESSE